MFLKDNDSASSGILRPSRLYLKTFLPAFWTLNRVFSVLYFLFFVTKRDVTDVSAVACC